MYVSATSYYRRLYMYVAATFVLHMRLYMYIAATFVLQASIYVHSCHLRI